MARIKNASKFSFNKNFFENSNSTMATLNNCPIAKTQVQKKDTESNLPNEATETIEFAGQKSEDSLFSNWDALIAANKSLDLADCYCDSAVLLETENDAYVADKQKFCKNLKKALFGVVNFAQTSNGENATDNSEDHRARNSQFLSDIEKLYKAHQEQQAGKGQDAHHNFAFLFEKSRSKDATSEETVDSENAKNHVDEEFLNDVYSQFIQDFYPDSVAHCQSAWDVRTSKVLQNIANVTHSSPALTHERWLAMPSIESVMSPNQFVAQNGVGKKMSHVMHDCVPSIRFNSAWLRSPDTMAPNHLALHKSQITTEKKILQQALARIDAKTGGQDNAQHQVRVETSRFLQKLLRETLETTQKVMTCKRAPRQMVKVAELTFKSTPGGAPIVALRDHNVGFDMFVCLSEQCTVHFVPNFHLVYTDFVRTKHQALNKRATDCFVLDGAENENLIAALNLCKKTVVLKRGQILMLSPLVPRWFAGAAKEPDAALLPVHYQWVDSTLVCDAAQQNVNKTMVDNSESKFDTKLPKQSVVCPVQLAFVAAYEKCIRDGVVYTSMPHLLGNPHFARTGKKGYRLLENDRSEMYNQFKLKQKELSRQSESAQPAAVYKRPSLPDNIESWMEKTWRTLKDMKAFVQHMAAPTTKKQKRRAGTNTTSRKNSKTSQKINLRKRSRRQLQRAGDDWPEPDRDMVKRRRTRKMQKLNDETALPLASDYYEPAISDPLACFEHTQSDATCFDIVMPDTQQLTSIFST